MIKNKENKWIVDFTQSNCYKERQYKTIEEYNGGNIGNHSNMKRMTVNSNSLNDLFLDFGRSKIISFPLKIENVKIYKHEIIELHRTIRLETRMFKDWFVDPEKAFFPSEVIANSPKQYFEGTILIQKRDPNRKEIIARFGEYDNHQKFVDKKDSRYLFNEAIFSCAFSEIVNLEFSSKEKIVKPVFLKDKFISFIKERPVSKILHRRTKKELIEG